jgi:hypothetical protein
VGGAALTGIFLAAPCRAESVEGRVRLGFEGGVVGYQSVTAKGDGVDASMSDASFSLASTSFGPGVSYGIDDTWMIGARASFITRTMSWQNDVVPEATSSGLGLYVSAEYLLGEGSVRPFVGPLAGIESTSASSGGAKASASNLLLGVQGGLHAFATSSFSIDPSVLLAYTTGSTGPEDHSLDVSGFTIGLRLAMSGWLGGEEVEPVAADTRAAEPPTSSASPSDRVEGASARSQRGDGHARQVVASLPDSVRLIVDVDEGGTAHFKYIAPAARPDETCGRVTVKRDETEEDLAVERASVVQGGFSSLLVVEGTVPPGALKLTTSRRGTVVLIGCEHEAELSEAERARIRGLRAGAAAASRPSVFTAGAP